MARGAAACGVLLAALLVVQSTALLPVQSVSPSQHVEFGAHLSLAGGPRSPQRLWGGWGFGGGGGDTVKCEVFVLADTTQPGDELLMLGGHNQNPLSVSAKRINLGLLLLFGILPTSSGSKALEPDCSRANRVAEVDSI